MEICDKKSSNYPETCELIFDAEYSKNVGVSSNVDSINLSIAWMEWKGNYLMHETREKVWMKLEYNLGEMQSLF